MVDIFQETDEQLRAEQFRTLVSKWTPWVGGALAAALLIVLAVWGVQSLQQQSTAKASEAYNRGVESLGRGDLIAAFSQFQIVAASPSKSYKALALMQEAGIRLTQSKPAEAVSLFDQAAAAAPNAAIGDAARLKAAYILLDTAPYAQLEVRLKPLMDAQRPFKAQAREALAMAKLKSGRPAAARADFVVVTLLSDSTDDMRQRAQAAIALIDSGSAAGLPALANAILALPPPPAGVRPEGPAAQSPNNGAPASDQSSQAGAAQ